MRLRNPTASLDTIPRRLVAALFLLFVAAVVATLTISQASGKFSKTATNTGNTYAASSCFQPIAVAVTSNVFTPASMTIKAGCAVKWTVAGGTQHTSTSTSPNVGLWNSGNMSGGQNFTYTFLTAGFTYNYRCSIHSGMTGTVTVN